MAYRRKREAESPNSLINNHQKIFLERYERLHGWAMSLSAGNRANAEDLLHDTFVTFMSAEPQLDSITNIDGYLRRMMQHVNYRRYNKNRFAQFSPIEFDSAEIALRSASPQDNVTVRDTLTHICRYACIRKESSRIGSAFILRYFFDYLPSEISRIIGCSRINVDQLLKRSRDEARLYITSPQRLSFLSNIHKSNKHKIHINLKSDVTPPDTLLAEFRKAIYKTKQTRCSPPSELAELYSNIIDTDLNSSPRIEKKAATEMLAHIVSCPICFDKVNFLLGLPSLDERYYIVAHDSDDDDDSSNDLADKDNEKPGRKTNRPTKTFFARCRTAYKQIIEHRPEELWIFGNSIYVGSMKITSPVTDAEFVIQEIDSLDFIEIESERGISMLTLFIGEPQIKDLQIDRSLSNKRRLNLGFKREHDKAALSVSYFDPLMQEDLLQIDIPGEEISTGEFSDDIIFENQTGELVRDDIRQSGITGIWRNIRTAKSRIAKISEQITGSVIGLRASIILTIIIISVLITYFFSNNKFAPITGIELLTKAVAAESLENESTRAGNEIIGRKYTIEERLPNTTRVISRQRVEMWQDPSRKIMVRRLYDENNQLIAGEWSAPNKERVVYKRGLIPQKHKSESHAISTDDIWMFEPSSLAFKSLLADTKLVKAQESDHTFVINYNEVKAGKAYSSSGPMRVIKASLILRKDNLHAIEMNVLLESAANDKQLREFSINEQIYNRHKPEAVSPKVFEPDPVLIGGGGTQYESTNIAGDMAGLASSLNPMEMSEDEVATTMVNIYAALDSVGAHLKEDITVKYENRKILIDAKVDTLKRKQEVLQVLSSVSSKPGVITSVKTFDELSAIAHPQSNLTVLNIQSVQDQMPAHNELYTHFAMKKQRMSEVKEVNNAVYEYAVNVIRHSANALSHARAMRQIRAGLSEDRINSVSHDIKAKWLKMISEHAQSYEREIEALRIELGPVFFKDFIASGVDLHNVSNLSLTQSIDELYKTTIKQDSLIKSSFTVSNEMVTNVDVKTREFYFSLLRSVMIARQIREAVTK